MQRQSSTNPYLHPCMRKLATLVGQALSKIGNSGAVLYDTDESREKYEQVLSAIASDEPRHEQLMTLKRDLITMRLRLAVDYSRSLPAIIECGSVYSVFPMCRISMEAVSLLHWHTDRILSPEERVLRMLRDANQSFTKAVNRSKGHTQHMSDKLTIQADRIISVGSAEMNRAGLIVEQTRGKWNRCESDRVPKKSKAVEDRIKRTTMRLGDTRATSNPSFMYERLSDAVHADAMTIIALSSRNHAKSDSWYAEFVDIAHVIAAISMVMGMLMEAFGDAQHHSFVDFPFEDVNQCLLLMVDMYHEYGDEDAFININEDMKALRRSERHERSMMEQHTRAMMSPHAL